jgi:hypothetical protein
MYNKYTDMKKVAQKSHSQLDSQAFSAGHQQGRAIHLGSALGTSKVRLLGN